MFANSIAVVLLALVVGVPTLLFLIWGLRYGQFEDMHASSMVIFDDEELRYRRPWERPLQSGERVQHYGSLLHGHQDWRKWL
jgi:cbb3-type cytochrome oxidase maturation protein